MSKEYPSDRKQQTDEDQERMSRILKRRADAAAVPGETPVESSVSSQTPNSNEEKARSAASGSPH